MKEGTLFGKRFHAHRAHDATWTEGRVWMHWEEMTWGFEWHFGRRVRLCHAHLDLDHVEPAVKASISIPFLFGIYLTAECHKFSKWLPKRNRTVGVRINRAGTVSISLWEDRDAWSRDDPWWWVLKFNPADRIFGDTEYTRGEGKKHRMRVPLPEGCYIAEIELYEARWKRPRWPFARSLMRAEIAPNPPIPVPGKGESDWDCGDDATHSMTMLARTPEQAIGMLVADVLRTRHRHGGTDWMPSSGWPEGLVSHDAMRNDKHGTGSSSFGD